MVENMDMEKYNFKDKELLNQVINNCISHIRDGNVVNLFLETDNIKQIFFSIKNKIKKISKVNINSSIYVIEKLTLKPYYPFLKIIKDNFEKSDLELNDKNIDKVLAKADVYYFHRSLFKNYLLEQAIERKEKLVSYINDELSYEKQELYNSIWKLINFFHKRDQNYVYIIKNVHYIKESTMDLIEYIIDKDKKGKILFIYLLNSEYNHFEEKLRKEWVKFLEKIVEHDHYLNIESDLNTEIIENNFKSPKIKLCQENIIKILDKSQDLFNLLAIKETKKYVERIYHFLVDKNYKIDDNYYFKLLKLLGDTNFLTSEDSIALNYYNRLLDFAIKKNDKSQLSIAYRRLTMINLVRCSLEVSKKYANLSLKLAKELGKDKILILKSYAALYENVIVLLLDDDYSAQKYSEVFHKLEKKCKEHNFYNMLSRIYGFRAGEPKLDIKKRMEYCQKGIEFAKKYGNKNRLSALYHNQGMIYSDMGEKEKSFNVYKKSEKLKLEIGNPIEIIRIYNGIGYAYFNMEEYKKAVEYYRKNFVYLQKIKNENNSESGSVFFNLGIAYMFGLDYKKAIKFFEETINLLNVMDIDKIPYHSINKIYILISFCYFKVNNIIKGKEYINKITKANKSLNKEEKKYYQLTLALLNKERKHYDLAEQNFENIIKQEIDLNQKALFAKVFYEYALFLNEIDKKKKAESVCMTGIEICEKIKYDYHKKLILQELKGEKSIAEKINFKEIEFNISSLIDYIKQKTIMNDLYKKMDEINFLNNLQKIFLEANINLAEIIDRICKLIDVTFNIDTIAFYQIENYEMNLTYLNEGSNLNEDSKKEKLSQIVDFLLKDIKEKFISDVNDYPKLQKIASGTNSIINLPLMDRNKNLIGNIFLANQQGGDFLSEDIFRILSIASKQITVAFVNKKLELEVKNKNNQLEKTNKQLEKTNKELEKMVFVDGLTGISNRKIFDKTLSREWKRCKREKEVIALLMLDIDNFKGYNDTYGHQKGDECLIKLAKLFEKLIYRPADLVARYGGEEFAVILPMIDLSGTKKVAERIKKNVEGLEIKHKVSNVSDYITVSIGGALAIPSAGFDETILIEKADNALYRAKKAGRNQVRMYSKIIAKERE